MSSENDYCVIGLGKFGMSVVRTLEDLGKVCLAIDKNEDRVQLAANVASEVLILDSTNRDALEDAGIHKIKNIIIAVGSDLAASVVTAVQILALQKEYNDGEEINIVAKAVDSTHQLLLEAIGINNIILPELEAGRRAAYRAIWKLGLDLTTVDQKHSIAHVILRNVRLTNRKLENLQIPVNYNINLIAIKRDNRVIIPRSDEKLFLNDEVLFIGANENIVKVYNEFSLSNTKMPSKSSKSNKKQKNKKGLWGKKRP